METEKKGLFKSIVIIVLVVVIIALVGVYFFILKKPKSNCEVCVDVSADLKSYYCEKVISDTSVEGVTSSVKEKITYDATGEIISTKVIMVYKYTDKDKYTDIKEAQNGQDTENNYNFDDENMILEVEPKVDNILKNEAGQAVAIWYKEYIKSFQNEGYTCIKK